MNSIINQISNPQVSFSVHQKHLETIKDAVSANLQMESYLGPKPSHVCQVDPREGLEATAIDTQTELLQKLVACLDRLEGRLDEEKPQPPTS